MSNDQILTAQLFELLNKATKVLPMENVENITEFIAKENGG